VRRTFSILAATAVLVAAGSAPAVAGASDTGVRHATGYYLALGDSLAAGFQPGAGDDKTGGYVGHVEEAITTTSPKTRLVNLSCSGETAESLVDGGTHCTYDAGSQLAAALAFLHAHGQMTRQITLDIGANDVQRCVSGGTIDLACIQAGLTSVATHLPQILTALSHAAPNAQVLVLNYYNPFLAAWLTGPAGRQLAQASTTLQAVLNGVIAQATAADGATLVDIAGAFHSTDTTPVTVPGLGSVPTNVATICALTWMCTLSNIHANDAGYAVMGAATAARLD
jgi:lysophospholipase L1-like esterase